MLNLNSLAYETLTREDKQILSCLSLQADLVTNSAGSVEIARLALALHATTQELLSELRGERCDRVSDEILEALAQRCTSRDWLKFLLNRYGMALAEYRGIQQLREALTAAAALEKRQADPCWLRDCWNASQSF